MSMTTTTPTSRRWWQRKPKAVAVGTTTMGYLDSRTIQAYQFKPMSDWPKPGLPLASGGLVASRDAPTVWLGTTHHDRTTMVVRGVQSSPRTVRMEQELTAALHTAERHPAMTDYLLGAAIDRCLAIAKGR